MADEPESPIRAAGALVWRASGDGPLVALVHRPRYDDWSFPKGKCRNGEHVLAAAIREVAEETGVRAVLGRPLAAAVYPVGGRSKRVSYWTARCAEPGTFTPGREVDEVAWLPPGPAAERLSYLRDVALLDEMASGPVATAPLILLRHASAGRKVTGNGVADDRRPLDARGTADATTLAGLLASYGSCRVISSPAERCLATVRPYAAALGLAVTAEPALAVSPAGPGGHADPGLLRRAADLTAAVALAGLPALICAHRENLPVMLDAALGALAPGPVLRREPAGQLDLAKGAFVVLQMADGALASAEWHDVTA